MTALMADRPYTTDRDTARQSPKGATLRCDAEIEREVRDANLPRLMAIAASVQQAIARSDRK